MSSLLHQSLFSYPKESLIVENDDTDKYKDSSDINGESNAEREDIVASPETTKILTGTLAQLDIFVL